MTTRLLQSAACLLALLCSITHQAHATKNQVDASAREQGVTFSHVYKIDIPGSSFGSLECLQPKDEAGQQVDVSNNGENDIVFKHNIRLQTPKCGCEESEIFQSLVHRVNGLEEEVTYLKTQCAQGCCKTAGVDTSCSGNGIYQQETCSCLCNPGWEGPTCSESSCPDECSDNGRCVDGKCVCYEGFTGVDCSQSTCPNDCNDKGHCVDGKCVCFPQYSGEDCSAQLCPGNCLNSGRCVNGKCICDEGLLGEDCSSVLPPRDLRLVKKTDTSLFVKWEPVPGAEYYILSYHPKHGQDKERKLQVPKTEKSFLIGGLSPGVTYLVQVRAVIKQFQSEVDVLEATTDVSTVDDIQVLGQTDSSLLVDWKNPWAEVDYFKLTHTDPSGQEEEQSVLKSQEARTKHTIVGLYPGTEYMISVQTIRGKSEGKPATATGVTDIDTPKELVTTKVTEDTAVVSWNQVQAPVDGYMLSYTSAEHQGSDIPVGRDLTSYKLVGLRPGVEYTVYVWAYKGVKNSERTSTIAQTDLDAPRNLRASGVTPNAATLTWTSPVAVIDGYILTYSDEDGQAETVTRQLGSNERSFFASDLAIGKKYIATITAFRDNLKKMSKTTDTNFKTVGVLFAFPMNCVEVMKNGKKTSGIYTIYLNNDQSRPVEVYCDMDTDGGGWLMLQRRTSGKLDFMKRWKQYIAGFGNLTDEFWLGNENIYELTNGQTQYEVRFDLGVGNDRAHAVYDNFKIGPVKQKFKLTIGEYRGTAGDAMTYHQGRPWTTVDSDNDIALGNCALTHRGAWWYKNCHLANLNGHWDDNRHSMGVNWQPWKGHLMSLDFTEIKIRPVGAMSSRKRRSPTSKSGYSKIQKN